MPKWIDGQITFQKHDDERIARLGPEETADLMRYSQKILKFFQFIAKRLYNTLKTDNWNNR